MKNTLLLALVTLSASLSITPAATILIAHRGASYDAPENTVSATRLGFAQNAEATECDIYLTKDGKIIVMHDATTARTTAVSNKISQTNFEELRKLSVGQWGQWKGKGFADKVPTLDELLAVVPDGRKIFIEIKCGPEILPELERVLQRAGKKPEQTPIITFGYETAREAKRRLPQLEISWLVSPEKNKPVPPVEDLIAKARSAGLDGLDLNYGFPIDKEFTRKVHGAGLKLYTWTVDDPEVARKHVAAGVNGITTNRPQWLRQQIGLEPVS